VYGLSIRIFARAIVVVMAHVVWHNAFAMLDGSELIAHRSGAQAALATRTLTPKSRCALSVPSMAVASTDNVNATLDGGMMIVLL
jgi:hypothetical protein